MTPTGWGWEVAWPVVWMMPRKKKGVCSPLPPNRPREKKGCDHPHPPTGTEKKGGVTTPTVTPTPFLLMGGLWTVTGEEEAPAFATQQTGKHPPTYPRSAGTTCRRAGVAGPAHGGGTPPTLQGVILRTISPAHAGLEECPPLRLRSPCPTLAALCGGRRGGAPPRTPPRRSPGSAGAHPRPARGRAPAKPGHTRGPAAGLVRPGTSATAKRGPTR